MSKETMENDVIESLNMPEQEDVLMNEDELLSGLLEAANYRDDKKNQHKIQI